MRNVFISIAIMLSSAVVFAQQKSKVDETVLLDYYQTQRFAEASEYLKANYPEPVTDKKALGQLAYTANMSGRLADAENYYQRIYNQDSTNTGVLFSLGSINLRRGNTSKAESYYKSILSRDTTNFMVYKQLAQLSADKNDIASNIVYLQKANRINPPEPDVASDLSDMYVNVKLTPLAEKVLNKAIAADPENIALLLSLMKLTYAQKKWQETVDVCLKLMKNGNESGMVLTKLGIAYYNLKNYICGVETLAQIEKNQQSELTFYYSAMCYKALKDQKWAIDYFEKAIDDGISPSIASYYGEIADSNERLRKYNKAALAYQKALQFDAYPMLYYSLASLYDSELKDRENAVKYYKLYLAHKPAPDKQKNFIVYSKSRIAALRR
jgi:tetratricopeptide (TPR) repeat protein